MLKQEYENKDWRKLMENAGKKLPAIKAINLYRRLKRRAMNLSSHSRNTNWKMA